MVIQKPIVTDPFYVRNVLDHMIQQVVERIAILKQHVLYVVAHIQQTTEDVNITTDYTKIAETISTI
jgi:hypothetical protein